MPLRVADAIAILDLLAIERAHFVGRSWGGRLCFGICEHAPGRVRSLVIGGNQPYAWPESPISRAVGQALAAARQQLSCEPLARAFEDLWNIELPSPQRERLLANDPLALHAAFSAAMAEGPISTDLGRWQIPCLIFIGAADADFLEGAQRAAEEIPDAELLVLQEDDHYAAHMSQDESSSKRCSARCAEAHDENCRASAHAPEARAVDRHRRHLVGACGRCLTTGDISHPR